MDQSSCVGHESLPLTLFFPKTLDSLGYFFLTLRNLILAYGVYMINVKVAKVIPKFKTYERGHSKIIRPITIMSAFSKILEKIFTFKSQNTQKIIIY